MSDDSSHNSTRGNLCLECGMCCNGVIFADVKLQPKDDPAKIKALGLVLFHSGRRDFKFAQPCKALDGCRCRIYADRPRYCRDFDCILLQNVTEGRLNHAAARGIIRDAREKADAVLALLRALGDNEETLDLASRFRKMSKRFETGSLDDETADLYGRLTLAMHDLNCLLGEAFYR